MKQSRKKNSKTYWTKATLYLGKLAECRRKLSGLSYAVATLLLTESFFKCRDAAVLTQSQLASTLNAQRADVCRAVSKLRKLGLVSTTTVDKCGTMAYWLLPESSCVQTNTPPVSKQTQQMDTSPVRDAPHPHVSKSQHSETLISPDLKPDSQERDGGNASLPFPVGNTTDQPANRFEEWYDLFPNKVDRKKARDHWAKKIAASPRMQEKIIEQTKRQIKEREELERQGEFVPNWKGAWRWLRDERWNDDPATPKKAHRKKSVADIERANREKENRWREAAS